MSAQGVTITGRLNGAGSGFRRTKKKKDRNALGVVRRMQFVGFKNRRRRCWELREAGKKLKKKTLEGSTH